MLDTFQNWLTRSTHLVYFIGFAIWILPHYMLSLHGFYQIMLIIANYLLIIINLIYFFILLIPSPNHISKGVKTPEHRIELVSRYIDDKECPCGHIPSEKDLVHCKISGGCLEEYNYYSEYLGYTVYKDNRIKTIIFMSTAVLAFIFQFILSLTYIPTFIEYFANNYSNLYDILIQLPTKIYLLHADLVCLVLISIIGTTVLVLDIYLYMTNQTIYSFRKTLKNLGKSDLDRPEINKLDQLV